MFAYWYYVPVEISGSRNVIVVKIRGFLDSGSFYSLISYLRSNGFVFDRLKREWFKVCKNIEEDMNELENFLIDSSIEFVNTHQYFRSYYRLNC